MKEITQFAQYTVEIWRRSRQRHMHLTVRADGCVRVTCNKRRSKREILSFVEQSKDFIEKRVSELKPRRTFSSGEAFFFFGRALPLQIVWSWSPRIRLEARERELEMVAPLSSSIEDRRRALYAFYRRQARLHLQERLSFWSARMDLRPERLAIRGQQTRWGSCSFQRQISLNWKLVAAPESVIDYVIVHELAHLQHMNHSPCFWKLVESFFPDWRAAKKWLRQHEPEIKVQFE